MNDFLENPFTYVAAAVGYFLVVKPMLDSPPDKPASSLPGYFQLSSANQATVDAALPANQPMLINQLMAVQYEAAGNTGTATYCQPPALYDWGKQRCMTPTDQTNVQIDQAFTQGVKVNTPPSGTVEVSQLQGLPDSNSLMAYGLVGLATYMLVPKPVLVVGALAAYYAVTNK